MKKLKKLLILSLIALFSTTALITISDKFSSGINYILRSVVAQSVGSEHPWVDVRDFSSINAAVTAIGTIQTTLLIPNAQTLASSLIIPSTLNIKILKGGSIIKASTYTITINGPAEIGLYQVFSGFLAGDIIFGFGSIEKIHPEWFYSGSGYWENALQSAFDSGETVKIPVELNRDYQIHGTIYIGETPLVTKNGSITAIMNAGWTQRGTGVLKSWGAILIKSGNSAGYGIFSVNLSIENVKFIMNRTATGGTTVYAILALENCTGSMKNPSFIAQGSEWVDGLDLYRNVHDMTIENPICDTQTGAIHGTGLMVRNFDIVNPTKNIKILNPTIISSQLDEPLSIFIPVGYISTIEDVTIDNAHIYVSGAPRPRILTVTTEAAGFIRNVIFNNLLIESTAEVTAQALVKEAAAGGTIENVEINGGNIRSKVNSTIAAMSMVSGFDTVMGLNVTVDALIGANRCYAFTICDKVSSSKVSWDTGISALYRSMFYHVREVVNCQGDGDILEVKSITASELNGIFIDCNTIKGNRIEIGVRGDFPIFMFQTDGWGQFDSNVEGNSINDSVIVPTQPIFYSTLDHNHFLKGNFYKGNRTLFGINMTGTKNFDDNVIANSIGVIQQNSSRCPTASNPWTLFGDGVRAFPVGHKVWKSDPTTGTSAGWVKKQEPGTVAGDWLVMANNT